MANADRIRELNKMLQTEPDDVFLNYALGIELVSSPGSEEAAENQFKKVLELDPNYIAAFYQLGKFYEAGQRVTEALVIYKKGLEEARLQKNNKAINEFGEAIFMLED